MRILLLVFLGAGLEALNGACSRIFHLEWLRPAPLLTLLVYATLVGGGAPSLLVAFLLGLLADGVGGAPLGAYACGYLLLWALLHAVRRWLLPETAFSRLALVFLGGLVLGLFSLSYPLLADVPAGAARTQLIAWIPVAAFSALLAPFLWPLARLVASGRGDGKSQRLREAGL